MIKAFTRVVKKYCIEMPGQESQSVHGDTQTNADSVWNRIASRYQGIPKSQHHLNNENSGQSENSLAIEELSSQKINAIDFKKKHRKNMAGLVNDSRFPWKMTYQKTKTARDKFR